MFRKEFCDVISKTGMIPIKDLRPLLKNQDEGIISEMELLKFSYFDDIKFAKAQASNSKLTFIELYNARIKEQIINLIKKSQVIKYRCLPIQKTLKAVTVAIYDPTIVSYKSELQQVFQHPVEFIITNLSSWKKIYEMIEDSTDELLKTIKEVSEIAEEKEESIDEKDIGEDIINYVNRFIVDAYVRKASDIHIEPYENFLRIRFRIDGTLQEVLRPSKKLMLPIISRIKILSKMDISEKRKPQDGRIKISISGTNVDFRVSSLPTIFGEKIVLRILDKSNLQLDMTKLGLERKQLDVISNNINKPFGMFLVTGPTGSGKTTTLYSSLAELNKSDTNISTIEDPVEFNIEGINQVNTKSDIGLTFATALRSFLRQDPDIIMVGEIRDSEVAEIAVEAALTGHLVFSTLHTNDAASTVIRLINMGIESFLVSASLNVVIAQRLCRMICSSCKEIDTKITKEDLIACGLGASSAEKIKVHRGRGCERCGDIGYKGRVAIYETLEITPSIKEIILKEGSVDEIKKQAIKEGMKTLRMSALTKMAMGLTTLEEAIMNSSSDKF